MSSQFTDEVFPAEFEEIAQRRRKYKLEAPAPGGPPSVRKGLIGLALSGGGIRSAAFSLGVIQSLIQHGKFRFIDYLSTVSGGGYIGSCLSSVLNRPEATEEAFRSAADTPVVKHLRNCSNYLMEAGAVNHLRLPMILFRGILLNFWLLIPPLILAVFFTEVLTELWHRVGTPKVSPLVAAAPFLILAILYPTILRLFGRLLRWRLRNLYEKTLAGLLALSVVILFLIPTLWLAEYCIDNNWDDEISNFFRVTSVKGGIAQVGLVIATLIAISFLIKALRTFPAVGRLIINAVVAVVGPLFIFAIYLGFCIFFVESPYFSNTIEPGKDTYTEVLNRLAKSDSSEKPCSDAAPITGNESNEVTNEPSEQSCKALAQSAGKSGQPLSDLSEQPCWDLAQCASNECSNALNEDVVRKELYLNGVCLPSGEFWVIEEQPGWRIFGKGFSGKIEPAGAYLFIPDMSIFRGEAQWGFYAVGVIIFVLNFFFFDANVTSTHGFYRDRLSRAFLIQSSGDGSITPNDDQKLSDLNADGSIAPYHLINTALNLPASDDLNLRGRNADFFTLSKRYCGSEHTGYCKTTDMEDVDRHLNLGSAMAVSAAAAAPNMGTGTKRYFVFMMTLLNVRLGYWMPNPSKIVPAGWLRKLLWPNVGPKYLLREALGKLDAKGAHVNLSDGGHIENLAVYQLLKRRSKTIIAVDAEADPSGSFTGLITLMRFARIDLGIRIDLSLEDLRKNEHGVSKSHWLLANIDYGIDANGQPETGHLLYLKSSLTGDENEYIKAYKSMDPTFPHQTTADQFFDETQFEVYRSLGKHIADMALADVEVEKIIPSGV